MVVGDRLTYPGPRGHVQDVICAAIRDCLLLEFEYDELHRVVAPYCRGFTQKGEVLRAIQVGGDSRSRVLDSGKLWTVEKIRDLRRSAIPFIPDDPHYNPRDRAMATIHCYVRR